MTDGTDLYIMIYCIYDLLQVEVEMITRRLGRNQDFEGDLSFCFVPSSFVNFQLLSTFVFPRYRLWSGRRSNKGRRCHLHVESAHSYRLALDLKNRFTRWSGHIHTVESFRAILSLFWDQDKSLSTQMWDIGTAAACVLTALVCSVTVRAVGYIYI